MRHLIWAFAARRDLRDIDEYLMERSPQAAARTLEAIFAKTELLRRFPAAGPVFQARFRTLSIGGTPYSLVYQTSDDSVEILRIRHEREDWR